MHFYKILILRQSDILFCKMDATRHVKNEDLNSIFKFLADRGKDGEIYSECSDFFRSLLQLSARKFIQFVNNLDDLVMFCPYGSEAENLKCYEPHDLGDIDIMIFPYLDNLMIEEERLEYSPENPLHVRISGVDHPVLQSCLVGDTVYVATSALKNFHPAIFGPGMTLVVDFFSSVLQKMEEEGFSDGFNAHLKNNAASPAMTLNMSHLFGSISERREMLKEGSQNFPINEVAAQADCIAHFLCVAKGIDYTRENAELLTDFLLAMRDTTTMFRNFSIFTFLPEIGDRFKKLTDRFQKIKQPSQHHALHDDNYHSYVPQEIEEEEGQKSRANSVRVLSAATRSRLCQNITPQNFDVDERSPEMVESHSSQSILRNESTKTFNHFPETPMPKKSLKDDCVNGNREGKRKVDMATDTSEGENLQAENEKRELKRRYGWWVERMLGPEPLTRQCKDSEDVKSGYDFIPSFKSIGWPKVAGDWIKKKRKWPSSDIVDKVVQEGFHLVVKAPKNKGNPECDFRISFSHAEYLLSQEMNDIQRECYRCLKRYHRCYLSTEPKSLVPFHLKNIFLQTIEETGADTWTESNRAECMMKLLGNLLKALTKKELRHFFVRSYNLFGDDYIENTKILENLAKKVEDIMEDPVRFSTQLILHRQDTKKGKMEESILKENLPSDESTPFSAKPAPKERQEKAEEISSKEIHDTLLKTASILPMEETQENYSPSKLRYHDLKNVYQDATKKLVEVTFHDTYCSLEAMGPLEQSLVQDLRELVREYGLPVSVFPSVFDAFWHKRAYYWIWISTEPDIRQRVLVAVKGLVELLKYYLKEEDFCQAENDEAVKALLNRMLHPCAQYHSQLNEALPSGDFLQLMHMLSQFALPQESRERSSMEKLRDFLPENLDQNPPFIERFHEVFDLLLETSFEERTRNKSTEWSSGKSSMEELSELARKDFDHTDPLERFLEVFELFWDEARTMFESETCSSKQFTESALKKEKASQGNKEKTIADFGDKMIDLITRSLREAQQNQFYNADDIPLD